MSEPVRFREDLIQAVDYDPAVQGEIVRVAICERIERNYPPARDAIPDQLETFEKVLQALLGAIAKNFHNGLPINEDGNWKLVDYVNHARKVQVSA